MASFQRLDRPNFFAGRLITAADLNRDQQYVIDRLRRRNRFLHGWGVASGLGVSSSGDGNVIVEPGLALDCEGNEIVVDAPTQAVLDKSLPNQYVCVRYEEVGADPTPSTDDATTYASVRECAVVEVLPANPNANHSGMLVGTPGCGNPHALCIAKITRRGSNWRVALVNRLAERRR